MAAPAAARIRACPRNLIGEQPQGRPDRSGACASGNRRVLAAFTSSGARLEQLCRYLLRPPLAQGRRPLPPNGRALIGL